MPNHLNTVFYGVSDSDTFYQGIQTALGASIGGQVFTGDNLFTFGKSLGFLADQRFMGIFNAQATEVTEQATVWRVHTLCWAARRALSLEGDFVECGSYRGTSSRILVEELAFETTSKKFVMFDVFDDIGQIDQHDYPALKGDIHQVVSARFTDYPNVDVIQGFVPDILEGNTPERIAFLHIDMNSAEAEIAALERLFDRVCPGGSIVLDDYGWLDYIRQKNAHDTFFGERGYQVLELPTGQGLVIK